MKGRNLWPVGGALLALIGAVLVFALENPDESVGSIELQPFGAVLFVAGLPIFVCTAVASAPGSGGSDRGGYEDSATSSVIRTMGGLIAVVSGTIVVGGLAAFTMTRLSAQESESAAIASSAFGVISAVIGAYLGIKISADQSLEGRNAAVAEEQADAAKRQLKDVRSQAQVAKKELSGLRSEVEELPKDEADKIMAAGARAREEEAQPPENPPERGGTE